MRASQQKKTLSTATFTIAEWDPQSLTDPHWTPEQYLQAEVLLQAWNDLKTPNYPTSLRARRLVREALAWIEGNDSEWIFSSGPICDSLGINLDALRSTFRATVAKHETLSPQRESIHITLVDKLMGQIPQPETVVCASREEAFCKRDALIAGISRLLDDPKKYRLRSRVVESSVVCWIEEGPTRCLYCDMCVAPSRRVCRFHDSIERRRRDRKERKRENTL